jgi:hypothetical protein
VAYRGPRGVLAEVYFAADSRLPNKQHIAAPIEVLRLLGDFVIRFENIEQATRYLLDHNAVLSRLIVI